MPAPTSPVDICNIALDYFGERANVTSIELPKLPTERILARHYDLVRRSLLREYVWNFARAETTLARTGDGGLDFADRYLMPTDCLRIISIGDRVFPTVTYNLLNNEIYMDNGGSNSLQLRYVKDVTDVSKYDDLFTILFATQLAEKVAYKFSKDKQQIAMIKDTLARELPKAISINSQQKKPRRKDVSSTILSRAFPAENTIPPDNLFWFDSTQFIV